MSAKEQGGEFIAGLGIWGRVGGGRRGVEFGFAGICDGHFLFLFEFQCRK